MHNNHEDKMSSDTYYVYKYYIPFLGEGLQRKTLNSDAKLKHFDPVQFCRGQHKLNVCITHLWVKSNSNCITHFNGVTHFYVDLHLFINNTLSIYNITNYVQYCQYV